MKRLLTAIALAAVPAGLVLTAAPAPLAAQVVEQPETFDMAGRISVITPTTAARLGLGPPAWRVTGDFLEARLYRLGDEGYVLAVRRLNGTVERYSLTREERQELANRVGTLPPNYEITTQPRERISERLARNAFVRDQTIIGLIEYAPAFAYAVSNNDAGRIATYLIAAGATFFTAAELSRQIDIDESQNRLATQLALHGGLAGYGFTYALDASQDGRALGVLLGGLTGTALGLTLGKGLTEGQVAATTFSAEVTTLLATGFAIANGPTERRGGGDELFGWDVPGEYTRGEVAAMVGTGLVGYPIGSYWARTAPYHITGGDVAVLWPAGAVGAALGYTFLGAGHVRPEAATVAMSAGFLGGLVAGDYFLVQQYDHSRYEAGLVALGGAAGALMGAGVARLIDPDGSSRPVLTGLLAAGGAAGMVVTEYIVKTPLEGSARRTGSRRWELSPAGAALAAAGVRGRHSLLTVRF